MYFVDQPDIDWQDALTWGRELGQDLLSVRYAVITRGWQQWVALLNKAKACPCPSIAQSAAFIRQRTRVLLAECAQYDATDWAVATENMEYLLNLWVKRGLIGTEWPRLFARCLLSAE